MREKEKEKKKSGKYEHVVVIGRKERPSFSPWDPRKKGPIFKKG